MGATGEAGEQQGPWLPGRKGRQSHDDTGEKGGSWDHGRLGTQLGNGYWFSGRLTQKWRED